MTYQQPRLPFQIQNCQEQHLICTSGLKGAAVCLLFAKKADEYVAIFTQRSLNVSTHKGQICLPGGHIESEESPTQAALRETEEEIGVPPARVKIIGGLPLTFGIDGRKIFPVVGFTDHPVEEFQESPEEVAEIIPIPWHQLVQEKSTPFSFSHEGIKRTSHLFQFANKKIWGITARIVYGAAIKDLSGK